jgi:hypothetical protein
MHCILYDSVPVGLAVCVNTAKLFLTIPDFKKYLFYDQFPCGRQYVRRHQNSRRKKTFFYDHVPGVLAVCTNASKLVLSLQTQKRHFIYHAPGGLAASLVACCSS